MKRFFCTVTENWMQGTSTMRLHFAYTPPMLLRGTGTAWVANRKIVGDNPFMYIDEYAEEV
jgi:hypothetical protein